MHSIQANFSVSGSIDLQRPCVRAALTLMSVGAAPSTDVPAWRPLVWSDGFEDGVVALDRGPSFAATSSCEVDSSVVAPDGSRFSLSFWSGAPGVAAWRGSGLTKRLHAARPERLRYYVRVAETQVTKGHVMLCANDEAGLGESEAGVAAWLMLGGRERGSRGDTSQIGLEGGEGGYIGAPYVTNTWHLVELHLDWRLKRLRLKVDGTAAQGESGGTTVAFRDRSIESISVVRLANRNFAQVWFDSFKLEGPPVATKPVTAAAPPPAAAAPPPAAAPAPAPERPPALLPIVPPPPPRPAPQAPPPLQLDLRCEGGAPLLCAESLKLLCEQRVGGTFPTTALRCHGEGYLVYTATLPEQPAAAAPTAPTAAAELRVSGAAYELHAYVDGVRVGALRANANDGRGGNGSGASGAASLPIEARGGATLQLLAAIGPAAATGRAPEAADVVGIRGCVSVGREVVFGWEIGWVPRASVPHQASAVAAATTSAATAVAAAPACARLWHCSFELPPRGEGEGGGGGVLRAQLQHMGGGVSCDNGGGAAACLVFLNGQPVAQQLGGGAGGAPGDPRTLPRTLLRLGQTNELAVLTRCFHEAPAAPATAAVAAPAPAAVAVTVGAAAAAVGAPALRLSLLFMPHLDGLDAKPAEAHRIFGAGSLLLAAAGTAPHARPVHVPLVLAQPAQVPSLSMLPSLLAGPRASSLLSDGPLKAQHDHERGKAFRMAFSPR